MKIKKQNTINIIIATILIISSFSCQKEEDVEPDDNKRKNKKEEIYTVSISSYNDDCGHLIINGDKYNFDINKTFKIKKDEHISLKKEHPESCNQFATVGVAVVDSSGNEEFSESFSLDDCFDEKEIYYDRIERDGYREDPDCSSEDVVIEVDTVIVN